MLVLLNDTLNGSHCDRGDWAEKSCVSVDEGRQDVSSESSILMMSDTAATASPVPASSNVAMNVDPAGMGRNVMNAAAPEEGTHDDGGMVIGMEVELKGRTVKVRVDVALMELPTKETLKDPHCSMEENLSVSNFEEETTCAPKASEPSSTSAASSIGMRRRSRRDCYGQRTKRPCRAKRCNKRKSRTCPEGEQGRVRALKGEETDVLLPVSYRRQNSKCRKDLPDLGLEYHAPPTSPLLQ